MKVYELIEKLKEMPDDAEVFVYSYIDEGDGPVKEVKMCCLRKEEGCDDMDCDDYYYNPYMKQYSCKGDSCAAIYLLENKSESHVVVIGEF